MAIGKAIKARLTAHAGTDALVDGRIYPEEAPQGPTYPLIVYQVIGAPRTYVMGGATGEVDADVQIDCYAGTYEEVGDLATQVRLALNFFAGTSGGVVVERVFLDNEFGNPEPQLVRSDEVGIRRRTMLFTVHYAEAVA